MFGGRGVGGVIQLLGLGSYKETQSSIYLGLFTLFPGTRTQEMVASTSHPVTEGPCHCASYTFRGKQMLYFQGWGEGCHMGCLYVEEHVCAYGVCMWRRGCEDWLGHNPYTPEWPAGARRALLT